MVETALQTSYEIDSKERVAHREKAGYNLLYEVENIQRNLTVTENGYDIPPDILDYTYNNEKTATIEAATQDMISVTHQRWDKDAHDCVAFGSPVLSILGSGIDDARSQFEYERRVIEFHDAEAFNTALADGAMNDSVKVTFSPFPDDVEREAAEESGYKGAMVRLFSYDAATADIEVHQINFEVSDNQALASVARMLGAYCSRQKTSNELLATQIYVPKETFPRGVVDIAEAYDRVLEYQAQVAGNDTKYLCGRPVLTKNDQDYNALYEKSEILEHTIDPLIQSVVDTDVELAISLHEGKASTKVQTKIQSFLQLDEETGALSTAQKDALIAGLLGTFTKDTAHVLKSLELVRTWSVVSSLANARRAEALFGKDNVARIRQQYADDPTVLMNGYDLDRVIASAQKEVVFIRCGGKIQSGVESLYAAPLETVQGALFGDELSIQTSEPFKCPDCKHTSHKPVGNRCPHCGLTKETYSKRLAKEGKSSEVC